MLGVVHGYFRRLRKGVISGNDGKQYNFLISDYQGDVEAITPGMKIEFDLGEGDTAISVRPATEGAGAQQAVLAAKTAAISASKTNSVLSSPLSAPASRLHVREMQRESLPAMAIAMSVLMMIWCVYLGSVALPLALYIVQHILLHGVKGVGFTDLSIIMSATSVVSFFIGAIFILYRKERAAESFLAGTYMYGLFFMFQVMLYGLLGRVNELSGSRQGGDTNLLDSIYIVASVLAVYILATIYTYRLKNRGVLR